MIHRLATLLTVQSLLGSAGCASSPLYIGTGAAAGGAIGGVSSYYISNHSSKDTVIGTAIGTVSGGLLGYLVYWLTRKKEDSAQNKAPLGPPLDPTKTPQLTRPKVDSVWVPDRIEGSKYIEGHRVYILEENSAWSKE